MNKRGVEAGTIIGWILVAALVGTALYGFFSPGLCDKLLICVGVFGLLWLFFGSSILIKVEKKNFIIFSALTILSLILWTILTSTGVCITIVTGIKSLPI